MVHILTIIMHWYLQYKCTNVLSKYLVNITKLKMTHFSYNISTCKIGSALHEIVHFRKKELVYSYCINKALKIPNNNIIWCIHTVFIRSFFYWSNISLHWNDIWKAKLQRKTAYAKEPHYCTRPVLHVKKFVSKYDRTHFP